MINYIKKNSKTFEFVIIKKEQNLIKINQGKILMSLNENRKT